MGKVGSLVLMSQIAEMMMSVLHAEVCGNNSFLNGWFSCKSHMAEMTFLVCFVNIDGHVWWPSAIRHVSVI